MSFKKNMSKRMAGAEMSIFMLSGSVIGLALMQYVQTKRILNLEAEVEESFSEVEKSHAALLTATKKAADDTNAAMTTLAASINNGLSDMAKQVNAAFDSAAAAEATATVAEQIAEHVMNMNVSDIPAAPSQAKAKEPKVDAPAAK